MLLREGTTAIIQLPDDITFATKCLSTTMKTDDIQVNGDNIFKLLKLLWTRAWTTDQGSQIGDPTVQYLALSTIQAGGGFTHPKYVTNVIARIEYCMRLMFLKAMHNETNIQTGVNDLKKWFVEKNESTFNSLQTLQHVASSIAYTTIGVANVFWKNDDYDLLIYKGCPIHFKDFPSMFEAHEGEIVDVFQNDVLCGLELSVEYGHIFDDPSNTTPGYSFIHDSRNPFGKHRTTLLDAILASPELYARFIISNDGERVRWNNNALHQWLRSYSKLQRLQLVRANMTTGSPSRGTELTAMLLTNTQTYPLRNCMVFGSYVTLLCTYLKTSHLSGNDKCIPHALDAFSSDVLIQDLSIARPFAELAAHVCYNKFPGVVRLYRTHLFVNQDRLFDTDDLTTGLELLTLHHLGIKLGVRHWRHVNTAFRRKICPHMDLLLDDEEKDSIPAIQSGHSRSTENRLYGISQDGLVGASEDFLPLFLEASTHWQVACSLVPGGLGIPYAEARVADFPHLVQQGKIKPRSTTTKDNILAHVKKGISEYIVSLETRLIEQEERLNRRLVEQQESLIREFTSVLSRQLQEQESRLIKCSANADVEDWYQPGTYRSVSHALIHP